MLSSHRSCVCSGISPCPTSEQGSLYLWLPVHHTLEKVTSYLDESGHAYSLMPGKRGLSVICQPGMAAAIAPHLATLLTPKELQDTQVLFIRGEVQPQLEDFSDIISLQRFVKFSQSDWLVEMLRENRFTNHFQPIVYGNNPSHIYGYEVLLRGIDVDGNLVSPGQMMELAAEAGLLSQLDRVARLNAIAAASHHHLTHQIFINFAPTALYDPVSCLRSTVEAIDRAGIAHHQVIFEVVESDKPQDVKHLKAILDYYRNAGFLVALDDIGSGYSSLNLLHQLRPDFLKLDMELIRDVHQDDYKANITEKVLEITHQLGIKTVAEGIECVEELRWVQERGATFVQGYLIAKPSATPIVCLPGSVILGNPG